MTKKVEEKKVELFALDNKYIEQKKKEIKEKSKIILETEKDEKMQKMMLKFLDMKQNGRK